ncbi:MAG: hypothetical protein AB1779_00140 [Candidatus Thermoplasmatota archaeon]
MNTKPTQVLGIQLKAQKESYSVGEKINVTVILKNLSDAPITINKRMGINPKYMPEGYWEVKFDIVFPPGKRLIRCAFINRGKLDKEDFTLLQPGEEKSEAYTLTDWYWMKLPGIYEVKVTYHNSIDGKQFGLSAWTGEITSKPVFLRVVD